MTDTSSARAFVIFDGAMDLHGDEREAWLRSACGEDAEIREQVDALLATLDEQDADEAATLALSVEPSQADRLLGTKLGNYRITSMLGEGGMGTVFLAERIASDFDQRVAVKVMRDRIGDSSARERFDHERDMLANLEHPYIAKLFDGGLTDDGAPYFIMEYVDGKTIDTYCDDSKLSVRERLRLLVKVCEAVAVAQRNLIVHRDIKPGNILVMADATPKLLDFGIAKALSGSEANRQLTVASGSHFTPGYAAPEQVTGANVTMATDVFALGALAYRLLVGQDALEYDHRSLHDIVSKTAESRVTRPSRRTISTEDAHRRGTTPDKLSRTLRGDLDEILLKALAKDPIERYATSADLRDDIERYLQKRPVGARQPTWRYRAGKYLRRHPFESVLAAVAGLSLLAGVGTYLWQQQQVVRALRQTEQVNTFLVDMLGAARPRESGRDVRVVEVLADSAKRIDTELADDPLLSARLKFTIADSYLQLGEAEQALPLAEQALALRQRHLEPNSHDVAEAVRQVANSQMEIGEYHEAIETFERGRTIQEARGDDAGLAEMLSDLGVALGRVGREEDAREVYEQVLAIHRADANPDPLSFAIALNNLAVHHGMLGRLEEAMPLHEEALGILEQEYGLEHPDTVGTLFNLASARSNHGNYDTAEPQLRQALEIRLRLLGESHPDTILSMLGLADNLTQQEQFEESASLADSAFTVLDRDYGPDVQLAPYALLLRGQARCQTDDPATGQPDLEEALARRSRMLGEDHWLVANTRALLGMCLTKLGRFDEAAIELAAARAQLAEKLGEGSEKTVAADGYIRELEAARKDV